MHHLSASEQHRHFIEGATSAEKIVSSYLARIADRDGELGAFLAVYNERSLEKARKLDQKRASGEKVGKLAGVTVALKDNIHVQGTTTTCGSKFLTNYKAVFDATVSRLIEEEDGIILGKTNLDEFAMGSSTENSALQKTHNPWDLKCVPGGSSGGSTAAVAARLCAVALGSDTGGSVRQPASFCGVLGFKPSYGRVSRFGLVAFASSLDQIGPIATTTEDIGRLMEVIGKHDPQDATSSSRQADDYLNAFQNGLEGKTIGIPSSFLKDLNATAKENFQKAIEVFKSKGVKIIEINLDILKYSVAVYYILATAEASTNLARFDGVRFGNRSKRAKTLDEVYDFSRSEGFGAEVKKRILIGTFVLSSGYQDAYYKQASKVRIRIIEEFEKAFAACDVIATPVTPTATFKAGAIADPLQMYLQDIFTIGPNLATLPAISVPSGFTQEGLPLGLQLIGRRNADVLVCRFAHAFEKATGFTQKIPATF